MEPQPTLDQAEEKKKRGKKEDPGYDIFTIKTKLKKYVKNEVVYNCIEEDVLALSELNVESHVYMHHVILKEFNRDPKNYSWFAKYDFQHFWRPLCELTHGPTKKSTQWTRTTSGKKIM